ncbi:nicolin-1-like isoform X2 [Zootoca vivipara]|uniref:nicolin-1-like isoform X2 n=1 Tax=Zootoca vivipara TaxID=8524 RepID=UPI00293BDEB7|nr:nicolin-1-like isoform X2 [Zootoca vivipara]
MAREAAQCTVRNAVAVQVDGQMSWRPGASVIDVLLPRRRSFFLQEIVFRNYYTAFLTVRMQQKNFTNKGSKSRSSWVTCLRNYCLMPNPHTEEGSQDYFCFSRNQMLCSVDRAIAMRLILRQPSPTWIASCDPWLPGQLSVLPTLDGISKDLQWHQEHQAAISEHPAIPLLCISDTKKDKKAVWRTCRKVSLSDSHIHQPKSGQETFVWWMAVIIVASSTREFSKHENMAHFLEIALFYVDCCKDATRKR